MTSSDSVVLFCTDIDMDEVEKRVQLGIKYLHAKNNAKLKFQLYEVESITVAQVRVCSCAHPQLELHVQDSRYLCPGQELYLPEIRFLVCVHTVDDATSTVVVKIRCCIPFEKCPHSVPCPVHVLVSIKQYRGYLD